MALDTVKLPKNKADLARVIDEHADREESRLSYRRVMWLLAWHYLCGARRFDVFDPTTGALSPHYLDEEGMLLEDITAKDPVHAKARKLQNQLKTTTFKLYDKAKTYSGITGEDEKARAFQYVVGRQFEEELPGNVPTPQFQPNPNVQKKTDEELLRELQQLKQRK